MNAWTEMTSLALLGTGRGRVTINLPGSLDALLAGTEAETRLLRAAGVLGNVERAARIPPAVSAPTPGPAAPEETPAITKPEIIGLLARIIAEARPRVVNEACELLARNSRCLPPRLLPRVLELGVGNVRLRESLRPVLGKRGAWLAAQNPSWKFAMLAGLPELDERLWHEGDPAQRLDFLAQLRLREAPRARQFLAQTFADDTPKVRADLLSALQHGLGRDDEEFLQNILATDRSKDVRQTAAALLSCLPQSAMALRMSARLEPCVRLTRKTVRSHLSVQPPESLDAAWKADAIDEKPGANSGMGERAWWLLQLVALTPLAWWEQHLAMAPAEIVAAIGKTEWKDAVFAGLVTAVRNQLPPAWIVALLERGGFRHDEQIALAKTLPGAEAEKALQRIFSETNDAALASQIIELADFPWSVAFWQVAKQKVARWVLAQDWTLRGAITCLASRVPAAVLHEDVPWPDNPLFAEAVADFSRILEQRRLLHQLLKP